jgi:ketosteroid isomerase-like protein
MDTNPYPITGRETPADGATPYRALCEFYRAFNSGDLALMARNWAQSGEASMDNPLGGIKRGWPQIRSVYERIFAGPAQVQVEFYDYTLHEGPDFAFAVGRERGTLRVPGEQVPLAIRTTRLFRRLDGRWRQVHHHGSMEEPELLGRYQRAVLGAQFAELRP